ncbi:hypothetical protein EUX98_g1816 [Antrodiella citrinella]|uniref:SET domain-containing protein n=1 Tax=Antrodiella citrinella TaxID=2447956 RepID=A0A4V3XJA8_9APHY|nr:hypothetical protein EUX98_g1816 [Antrodiella citrinella]
MTVSSSSFLEIRTTPQAGRSYYSTTALAENTRVLDISTPYTYTIYKQFRNEVCSECFKYDGGRRNFLTCREHSETAGLSFCVALCRDTWLAREGSEAVEMLTRLEGTRKKGKQKLEDESEGLTLGTEEDIGRGWDDVRRDENNGKTLRKWRKLLLDEYQADVARYALLALHHLFQEKSSRPSEDKGDGSLNYGGSDWGLFSSLQDSEITRVKQIPALLEDHIIIYQVLKGLFTSDSRRGETEGSGTVFGDIITIENVRKTLGVDAGNSFGIWERPLIENSELLGFAVYPVPSFFNHGACADQTGLQKRLIGCFFAKIAPRISKARGRVGSYGS